MLLRPTRHVIPCTGQKMLHTHHLQARKKILVTPGHRVNHPGEKLLLATDPETAYIRLGRHGCLRFLCVCCNEENQLGIGHEDGRSLSAPGTFFVLFDAIIPHQIKLNRRKRAYKSDKLLYSWQTPRFSAPHLPSFTASNRSDSRSLSSQ